MRRWSHLAYIEAGSDQSPVLFLLHGGTMTAGWNWAEAMPILARRYRVIAPDSAGHGRSTNPRPDLRYEDMADDVLRLASALGVTRAAFYGFSDGAQVALELATRRPNLPVALVLSAVMYRLTPTYFSSMRAAVGADGYATDGWEHDHPDVAADFRLHHHDWQALAPQIWELWTRSYELAPDRLARVTSPTLLLTGDRDPFVSLEQTVELLRLLPCAELAVIPGAGHSYDHRFTTAAEDFLQRTMISEQPPDGSPRTVGHRRTTTLSTRPPSGTSALAD
jgi:pimeloyl-ACP methyl ester carboxylesterase